MKTVAACFLLLASLGLGQTATAAEVYKCVVDGKVQYQGKPCEGAAPAAAAAKSDARSTLAGCYTAPIKGMEDGFAVRNGANSPYEIVFTEGKTAQTLPLKPATRPEMQQIATGAGVEISEGLSVRWPPDTPNQKPVGLYKGRNRDGKDVYFAYFFFDAGLATRIPCK